MSSNDKKPRIIWWIDHLGSGGSQRVLTRLVEYMAEQGAKQSVVCLNASIDKDLSDRVIAAGAALYVVGRKQRCLGVRLTPIWALLQQQGFDVSVTFLTNADILGTLAAWIRGVPIRISAQRSSNKHYSSIRRRVIRMVLLKATCVVLNSAAYRPYARRFLPNGVPVYVIPNGVQVGNKVRAREKHKVHSVLGLSPDTKLLGCIGRLSPEKRVEDVIRALTLIEGLSPHLVLVGEGPEKRRLEALCESFGLSNRVHFIGQISDVTSVLPSLSLFVLASSFEGMSNSLLEAMAVGCPVAVSAVEENIELVQEGVNGWLFPAGDIQKLADTISIALKQSSKSAAYAEAAKEYVQMTYSESEMLWRWNNLLNSTCDSLRRV